MAMKSRKGESKLVREYRRRMSGRIWQAAIKVLQEEGISDDCIAVDRLTKEDLKGIEVDANQAAFPIARRLAAIENRIKLEMKGRR